MCFLGKHLFDVFACANQLNILGSWNFLRLISEINALEIGGLKVNDLFLLSAAFVNLEYPLSNGTSVKFLNDKDVYLGNQIEKNDSERCYGVVANEDFILVSDYGCNGAEPKIVLYKENKK